MLLSGASPRPDESAQRQLRAWLAAWLDHALAWRDEPGTSPRFDETTVILPAAFAAAETTPLARAAIAHIAAHRYHGGARFAVDNQKPLQVALVSLLEDARVERLAMAARPGLRALWSPYHRPAADDTTVPGLLCRLAAALFDFEREDGNAWVRKGRRLFLQHCEHWHDPAISRRLGNLLGNDLGQMRLQFNWKSHRPECDYRDDHHGLWDFERAEDEALKAELEARQLEPGGFDPAPLRPESRAAAGEGAPVAAGADEIDAAAELPEWDYARSLLRPRWVRLRQEKPREGDTTAIETLLADRVQQVQGLARRLQALRARRRRRRRQQEGDAPDLDACIENAADRRAGRTPDHRFYIATTRPRRDLAMLLLLDASQSTAEAIAAGASATLELEREAAALLAEAARRAGDRCAIAAFRSAGRDDVRLSMLRPFAAADEAAARAALAGLRPGLSTRLGAALRGAGRELARQANAQRWLLVISDGEPADIDAPEPRYLVEDARRAVAELGRDGIDVFGLGLDPAAEPTLRRIFGRRCLLVEKPERLGEQLQRVYRRLGEMAG